MHDNKYEVTVPEGYGIVTKLISLMYKRRKQNEKEIIISIM